MLQDHHHLAQNGMQRNTRMGMQQMGPPPNQRTPLLMSMPATGVLVSMPPGQALIPTATAMQSIQQPQQPPQSKQQPPPNVAHVYHYEPGVPGAVVQAPSETEQERTTDPAASTTQQQSTSPNTSTSSGPNATLANRKEKTPMCLVNELARYHKIQHQYRLTSEQGPAHKKVFTVTLKLGNEEYEAEGLSIKKAQHAAATNALMKTKIKYTPQRHIYHTRSSNPVTPTVELNALAMKRGEQTIYVVENTQPPIHTPPVYLPQPGYYRHGIYNGQTPPRYNFDMRRNVRGNAPYPYHDKWYYGQYRAGNPHQTTEPPCTVRLKMGDREYPGHGFTVQAARHDAASKAIEHIKQLGGGDNVESTASPADNSQSIQPASSSDAMTTNGGGTTKISSVETSGNGDVNLDLKSPISLVYEIALKRQLTVTFDVLSEQGLPHMKVFVTLCRVGTLVAEGEGNGKKISKKRAAEKMLEELAKLPPLANVPNVAQLKRKRIPSKKKTRNLIKVNMGKTSEINPISRLIQIQQAKKEREPDYEVLEERGAPRLREFVIEASVNDLSSTGIGPNKKIAKRNAAEALLEKLGYSSTTAQTPNPPSGDPKKKLSSKSSIKSDKDSDQPSPASSDKNRKVTFVEEKSESSPVQQSVGGSGGRQLVPGVLLVTEQNASFQNKTKETVAEKPSAQIMPPTTPIQGVRSKDQLLYLAQIMNIQVQFSDFPKANHEMYLTLVSLSTVPPQVCHGEGPTTEASHEKAALEALKVLSELGLDIVASPTKDVAVPATAGDNASPGGTTKSVVNQNGVKK